MSSVFDPKALNALLSEKAADLEVVSQRYDADGPMQDRALEIVRQFAADRKLKLYGGLAIDYALRIKGGGIYPDSKRPDFDMFSRRNVDDAYDLADILHRAGFPQVIAERAIHVQTMRVKIDFVVVADISYAPPEVFDHLPTLEYNGIQVLHPDYQRLDMHLAFCFPFNGAPREDIFHRWGKDIKRFNLLQTAYPIRAGELSSPGDAAASGGAKPAAVKTLAASIGIDASSEDVALHGIAAFGILQLALRELKEAAAAGDVTSITSLVVPAGGGRADDAAPDVAVSVKGSKIEVTLPTDHADLYGYLAVASPNPETIVAKIASPDVQQFEAYMDAKPKTTVITPRGESPLHVFSSHGRKLAVVAMRIDGAIVRIVSPQYLLLHFLHEAHQARSSASRRLMTQYYLWTLEMLAEGAQIIASSDVKDSESFSRTTFINSSPFGLTTRTMGSVNHDSAYIIKMAQTVDLMKDTPPASLHLDVATLKKITVGLPQRYVPSKGRDRPKFDYHLNPLFQRSGRLLPEPASSA